MNVSVLECRVDEADWSGRQLGAHTPHQTLASARGAERQSGGGCDSPVLLPTPLPPSSTK